MNLYKKKTLTAQIQKILTRKDEIINDLSIESVGVWQILNSWNLSDKSAFSTLKLCT